MMRRSRPVHTRTPREAAANRVSARRSYEKNRAATIAYRMDWRYRNRYGTTREEVSQKIEQQGNACAICGVSFNEKRPSVDHDHETGTPRGVLCQGCNVLVGHLESEKRSVAEAYIEAWKQ